MGKYVRLLLACCLLFLFCLKDTAAQPYRGSRRTVPEHRKKGAVRYGIASFYAKRFGGRTTSDGSSYSSAKLTAACNSLPLGTWVKVTNLKNKRSVIVQINDHLHNKSRRMIDLSKYAAQQIGIISRGLARVKIEVLYRTKKKRSPPKRKHS